MICKNCRKPLKPHPKLPNQWVHALHGWMGCDNEKKNEGGFIGEKAEPDKELTITRLLNKIDNENAL